MSLHYVMTLLLMFNVHIGQNEHSMLDTRYGNGFVQPKAKYQR